MPQVDSLRTIGLQVGGLYTTEGPLCPFFQFHRDVIPDETHDGFDVFRPSCRVDG